jgi:hypothetical protein
MAKDWKAQLVAAKEENLRLTLELQQVLAQMEEKIKQARRDEAVMIARDILEGRGGE